MTETTALTTTAPMALNDVMQLGPVLAQSGYFQDAREASQAIVKVLAGQEMGFGPIASMVGVHIIKGKPAPGANLMASAVKSNPRYDYQIIKLADDVCTLAFFENGKKVGESTFTAADAQKAGTQNMGKFPRNMLFARAISNGVRWFCPDVFNGVTAYTPEELGAEVDGDGEVIDVTPTVTSTPRPHQPSGNGHERPLAPETIRDTIRKKSGWQNGARLTEGEPITEGQVGGVNGLLTDTVRNMPPGSHDKARHDVLNYLLGVTSSKALTKREASAIIKWLKVDTDGEWEINEWAKSEVARILEAVSIEQGQMQMELEA